MGAGMKAIALAAALAAAPAPQPGLSPGPWLVVIRQVTPEGAKLARLTFERLPAGTRLGPAAAAGRRGARVVIADPGAS